jgi:hypothetical protein
LVEQLTSMHEYEVLTPALCDEPGGDDGLAKAVVAARTPVSCASIASAAVFWSAAVRPESRG